jgi:transcriptional regulator GlxA family with amidase domain
VLSAEASADAPGAQEVVTRLADVLLTQALRAALTQLQSSGEAGLLALGDRQIASAIELIHSQPEHGWAVGDLAHTAALLRCTDASLAQIAAQPGYGTEFSFGKAFKRAFGIAPGAYRGQPDLPRVQLLMAHDRASVNSHGRE